MNWYYTFIDALLVAFVVVMARHLLYRTRYFLHIFQQKGYKFGEFWHWLRDHWNERVITPEHVLYNLVILGLFAGLSDRLTGSAAALILSVFGFFWFGSIKRYRSEREKKPLVYTARVQRLLIPYGILVLFLPFVSTQISYMRAMLTADAYILAFGWVLGDILVPFLLIAGAAIVYPVEKMIQYRYKRMAREKLRSMPDLKVIAITGSYGKTSTKFMIRDLLKERYNVLATPGSYNTPMGICKVINNDLQAGHQVLVLEMGARYVGNIDELCWIAQPDISVVTNVGVAHLETFGSKEAIARTKASLVRNLKPGGTAVLNADDPLVRKMGDRGDIDVIMVGLEEGDIRARHINYGAQGTFFEVEMKDGSRESFSLKLLGAHNVQNMLFAIAVADIFRIRPRTMALAAANIQPVEHRLQLKKTGDLYVIDDAFNSNPVGAKNAVDILSRFETGRRIVITPGMIELGEIEEEENRKFGEAIGQAGLDLVILVGEQQTRPILEGIREAGFENGKVRVVDSLFEANDIVREFARPGDVILYENDLPDTYNE